MPTLKRLVFALPLLLAPLAGAGVVNIGLISFDVLTPGGPGALGVNVFDTANLTGDPASGGFALPPDFPVVTPLTFTLSSLVLQAIGQTIALGDIDPGQLAPPPDLQFPDGTAFSSAIFFATLNETNLTLSDGSTVTVSPGLQAVILPSSGNSLVAGTDFAVISATPVATTIAPEPGGSGLVCLALIVFIGYRFIKRSDGIHSRRQ